MKCFSLYGLNWSDSVLYGNMAFGDIRDYSLITTLFQYKNFCGSFEIVSILCKNGIFKSTSEVLLSLFLKLLRFSCFWECGFWRDERSQFENNTFWRKNVYGSFEIVSILCKKVFWVAPMKCFYLYGSNNWDFF